MALASIKNFSIIAGQGVRIVSTLSENDINPTDSDALLHNYSFLKRLDFLNQVMFSATTSILPSDKKKLIMFSRQMNFENIESLQHNLNEVMKSNKFLLQKYLAVN
ncbi:MAG: hypothetical protein MZV64_03380 [Ignavibacteriales bacterium]|nr:hypothetical protein [Ignavibacteriales bacterium]